MITNEHKSTLTTHNLAKANVQHHLRLFLYDSKGLDEGLKYLGFLLKPNNYSKAN